MQNFMQFSNVVDSVRSNAGSAVKSVQRTFEEQALKAAGLGEEEEVLYRLNKHAQAYLRAADAMQEAAEKIAQDFEEAFEDNALRAIAKTFREGSGAICTQKINALKAVADPIRQACDAVNCARRQQLVSKAFDHLLKVDLDSCSATGKLVAEVRDSAQEIYKKFEQPKAANLGAAPPQTAPAVSSPVKTTPPQRSSPTTQTPVPPKVSFEDLLGDSSSSKPAKGTADLLDFGFDEKPSMPSNTSSTPSTRSGSRTSSPLEHTAGSDLSFDFGFDGNSKLPPSTSTFDLGFDSFGVLGGTSPNPSNPSVTPPAVPDLGSLGELSWPSKEDEDESCIRARVESWQKGKNLRAMLVTLHLVAPSNCVWTGAQLDDVATPAGVKNVYRRAVLAVHPDKNQGKAGEKLLAHLVFQALREQWTVFNTAG